MASPRPLCGIAPPGSFEFRADMLEPDCICEREFWIIFCVCATCSLNGLKAGATGWLFEKKR